MNRWLRYGYIMVCVFGYGIMLQIKWYLGALWLCIISFMVWNWVKVEDTFPRVERQRRLDDYINVR